MYLYVSIWNYICIHIYIHITEEYCDCYCFWVAMFWLQYRMCTMRIALNIHNTLPNSGHRFGHQSCLHESSGQNSVTMKVFMFRLHLEHMHSKQLLPYAKEN